MTPFARLVRNVAERVADKYYEGPEVPGRFAEMARRFARMRLGATRAEWLDVAIKLAESAYRAGYVRGLEWAERDLDHRKSSDDVEEAERLERAAHDWEWHPGPPITQAELLLDRPVGDEPPRDLDPRDEDRLEQAARDHYFREFRSGVGPRRL